ncbi:MAG TPA: cyclic nucleotide-binding domain-containing protein [Vicinamibacterales bacterium]|nr:cyclic nucleotide-binding domain-containing protein [Vicinamibacterales bacterium]
MTRRPDLLAGLSEREAADVVALGVPVSLVAGEVLFELGEEATSLYVIQSGLITLAMPMKIAGREENVRIDERAPGQTVGWSTLIPPHRFTLTATAPVDTELLAFPRSRLLEHFENEPLVGYAVSTNIAALVGERLQVFQAMWLREMQQIVNATHA